MLADERTTHRNELSLPSEAEGLIVAPDRTIARPLVGFLRAQGLATGKSLVEEDKVELAKTLLSELGDAAYDQAFATGFAAETAPWLAELVDYVLAALFASKEQ